MAMRTARHDRVEGVGGPGGDQPLPGLDQRPGRQAQQLGGAVAEDQASAVDAVVLGERVAQLIAARVRVAMQSTPRDERDRVDDAGVGKLRPGRL